MTELQKMVENLERVSDQFLATQKVAQEAWDAADKALATARHRATLVGKALMAVVDLVKALNDEHHPPPSDW